MSGNNAKRLERDPYREVLKPEIVSVKVLNRDGNEIETIKYGLPITISIRTKDTFACKVNLKAKNPDWKEGERIIEKNRLVNRPPWYMHVPIPMNNVCNEEGVDITFTPTADWLKDIEEHTEKTVFEVELIGSMAYCRFAQLFEPYVVEAKETKEIEITPFIVVTDAGHGIGINGDSGASFSGNSDTEDKIALLLETDTAQEIMRAGIVKNKRTRSAVVKTSDGQVPYRQKIIKKEKADILISFHLDFVPITKSGIVNAAGAKRTNRILLLYHPKKLSDGRNGACDDFLKNSMSLINCLVPELRKIFTDRDIVPTKATKPECQYNSLGVLSCMDDPTKAATLIEFGNVHSDNTKFLREKSADIAKAISIAINKYTKSL